jgi:hypothetical protein
MVIIYTLIAKQEYYTFNRLLSIFLVSTKFVQGVHLNERLIGLIYLGYILNTIHIHIPDSADSLDSES